MDKGEKKRKGIPQNKKIISSVIFSETVLESHSLKIRYFEHQKLFKKAFNVILILKFNLTEKYWTKEYKKGKGMPQNKKKNFQCYLLRDSLRVSLPNGPFFRKPEIILKGFQCHINFKI